MLIGAFILFLAWAGRQSAMQVSQISDPAYYTEGLKYTHSQVEKQSATAQGWNFVTDIGAKRLVFTLRDKNKAPISKAQSELTLYVNAQKQTLWLHGVEKGAGRYVFDLPESLAGALPARIEFTRQGERLSQQLLINF